MTCNSDWWVPEAEKVQLHLKDPAGRLVTAMRFPSYLDWHGQLLLSRWVESLGADLELWDGAVFRWADGATSGWLNGYLKPDTDSRTHGEMIRPGQYAVLDEYGEWKVLEFETMMSRYRPVV